MVSMYVYMMFMLVELPLGFQVALLNAIFVSVLKVGERVEWLRTLVQLALELELGHKGLGVGLDIGHCRGWLEWCLAL